MDHTLLSDAALTLSKLLTTHRIHHGFFGGFAILSTSPSPNRETKDLDVLVWAKKRTITSLLSVRDGWLEIPQVREDYVAYFYKPPARSNSISSRSSTTKSTSTAINTSDSSSLFSMTSTDDEEDECMQEPLVLVEMFVGLDNARFPVSKNHHLSGKHMGISYVPILSEEYLFRGKLNAAATRAKQGGVDDILYLISVYGQTLRENTAMWMEGVDRHVVPEAIRRHPELKRPLKKVGVYMTGVSTRKGGRLFPWRRNSSKKFERRGE